MWVLVLITLIAGSVSEQPDIRLEMSEFSSEAACRAVEQFVRENTTSPDPFSRTRAAVRVGCFVK